MTVSSILSGFNFGQNPSGLIAGLTTASLPHRPHSHHPINTWLSSWHALTCPTLGRQLPQHARGVRSTDHPKNGDGSARSASYLSSPTSRRLSSVLSYSRLLLILSIFSPLTVLRVRVHIDISFSTWQASWTVYCPISIMSLIIFVSELQIPLHLTVHLFTY